jgi:asparagine synthetase B (glutamine-hydrolysing)
MLAVVADERPGGAREALSRAEASLGQPSRRLDHAGGSIAAWGPPPTLIEGQDWLAAGTLESIPERAQDILLGKVAARGDFALVGFDADGLVLTAGGAGGYRPIFVTAGRPGQVVAATGLDLLLKLMPERPTLDLDQLAAQAATPMLFHYPPEDAAATLMRQVSCVPMYEAWRVGRNGDVLRRSTWRDPANEDRLGGPADLPRVLREALRSALLRALSGHSRVGVMVSGGLDSSALLSLAVDVARRGDTAAHVDAFTWEYATHRGDDRPYLRSLARHLRVKPEVTLPRDAGPLIEKAMVQDSRPFHGTGGALLAALGAGVRKSGATLLITGVGGDDVVDGDPYLFADVARTGRPVSAAMAALRLRGACMGGAGWRLSRYVLRPLARALLPMRRSVRVRRSGEAFRLHYPWAGPRLRRHLDRYQHLLLAPRPRLDWTAAQRFEAMARSPYLAQFCRGRVQEEAIAGTARRDPFFDEEFLRTVATIPPLELLHGHYRRGLLREAMKELLPADVRQRTTKALMEPALAQMVASAGGFAALASLAETRLAGDAGIVEPRAFRHTFDELARNPDRGRWIDVWPVLAVEAFLRDWHQGARQP